LQCDSKLKTRISHLNINIKKYMYYIYTVYIYFIRVIINTRITYSIILYYSHINLKTKKQIKKYTFKESKLL